MYTKKFVGLFKRFVNEISPITREDILSKNEECLGCRLLIGNENAFLLAKQVKQRAGFEQLTTLELEEIAGYWWDRHTTIICQSVDDPNYGFDDFYFDFLNAAKKATPSKFEDIVKEALSNPLPEEALCPELRRHPTLQEVLAVCHYLANNKDRMFHLSAQAAGQVIGRDWKAGKRCLDTLCTLGKLKLVEHGDFENRISPKYQYIKSLLNNTK